VKQMLYNMIIEIILEISLFKNINIIYYILFIFINILLINTYLLFNKKFEKKLIIFLIVFYLQR
jgi:hypothetical protein